MPASSKPPPADEITEPPYADNEGGDGEQISENDPLHLLEGRGERLASVGNATLAMLVPSEDSSMDSERPASAQRTDGVRSAVASSRSRDALIWLGNDWLHR